MDTPGIPTKTIARLLASHAREEARLKKRYERNRERLARAAALGAANLEFVDLPGGERVVVEDHFNGQHVAGKYVFVSRYSVKTYKPAKVRKTEDTAAAA